jgi:hypothetical protein
MRIGREMVMGTGEESGMGEFLVVVFKRVRLPRGGSCGDGSCAGLASLAAQIADVMLHQMSTA